MKVFFAPDYREGVAYQALLSDALAAQGVDVVFPRGHRRVLPLWRGIREWSGDLLHLHWPEKFFQVRRDGLDFWRKVRYPLDLALTARHLPIVLTAHDLCPHNRWGETLLQSNFQRTYDAARAIIVHSEKAGEVVRATYRAAPDKVCVIPHGDLSAALGPLSSRKESRAALRIAEGERVCLMFGTVEPYKGIEPVLDWWGSADPPATLAVVGRAFSPEYGAALRRRAGASAKIRLEFTWQTDEALKRWLAAADCVLFHYRSIFTSGAACLSRSLGIPILIPARLDTVDLAEPHPLVFRFDTMQTGFRPALEAALATHPDYALAESWRQATAWTHIAAETASVYRSVA